jgi:Uma2 family endonuclease
MARVPLTEEQVTDDTVILNVEKVGLTDDQFFELCHDNRDFRLELTAQKELVIMTPPGGMTGRRNTRLNYRLEGWAEKDGTGVSFGPATLFALPNGARRGPDASWVRLDRWNALTDEQRESAPPFCPDFVMELLSKSQTRKLKMLHAKMAEYIDNGAQLGWLIDPFKKNVYIYRPGEPVQCLENPPTIHGDPVLPGFVFALSEIW